MGKLLIITSIIVLINLFYNVDITLGAPNGGIDGILNDVLSNDKVNLLGSSSEQTSQTCVQDNYSRIRFRPNNGYIWLNNGYKVVNGINRANGANVPKDANCNDNIGNDVPIKGNNGCNGANGAINNGFKKGPSSCIR